MSAGQLQHRGSSGQVTALKADSWTPVSCPCCHNEQVEPLVMIQLAPKIKPITKKWIISRIEAPETEGGEGHAWGMKLRALLHVAS